MLKLCRFVAFLYLASCFSFLCFAQKTGVVIVNSQSKELKRAAHRLRIPVEQIKHAREVLQEATDLVQRIDPYPFDQITNVVQMWDQVHRSKAKGVVESFIRDMRSKAAECPEFQCYQRATTLAMALMQSNFDYDKTVEQMRSWPDPKPAFGEAALTFRNSLETQIKNQAISRMAYSEPEKALKLLSETGQTETFNYSASGQIAQAFMNAGRKEEALKLIDQGISKFNQDSADSRSLQEFENFVRITTHMADSERTTAAVNKLVAALSKPNPALQCTATLRLGDVSVDLSCAESKVLNILRSMPMRPAFAVKTLDLVPGLRSKLDRAGGIDNLYGGGTGSPQITMTYGSQSRTGAISGSSPMIVSSGLTSGISQGTAANIPALIQGLKGKAESDPSLVRGKIKDLNMDSLVNLAMTASYQDPELAALALEMAQPMLATQEPLTKRASTLQNLIRASRQVDGEVDRELLRSGFLLADQIRQEQSEKSPARAIPINPYLTTAADQLELFLVSELSKDSFDTAINYARSLENGIFKLQCLIQIVQAQAQANF